MGRNMKKSKQNVVSKVKDFKKQKVKVGRKLKNIAETLPKVAQILFMFYCFRSFMKLPFQDYFL